MPINSSPAKNIQSLVTNARIRFGLEPTCTDAGMWRTCSENMITICQRKKDSFYAILKRKRVSTGISHPPHGLQSKLSTAELFFLLITWHKISFEPGNRYSCFKGYLWESVIRHSLDDQRSAFFYRGDDVCD